MIKVMHKAGEGSNVRNFRRGLCVLVLAAAALRPAAAAPLSAADIVSVQGTGQFREADLKDWSPARVEQPLFSGYSVRTGEFSRMGLLFRDRTQLRLNEKTLLQIKDAATRPHLLLGIGRAWAQTKTLPHNLYVETPSAAAAIRGTDWDLEVDERGRSMITVLSGEVEFFNDFGRVIVRRNESAEAQVGKAPVKLVLVRPRDRVQWVTAFAIEPLRHISLAGRSLSELAQAAQTTLAPSERGRVLADLGRGPEAEAEFGRALSAAPGDASARIGAGYVALQRGKTDEARSHFDRAASAGGRDAELLALGRIALAMIADDLGRAFAGLAALTREAQVSQPAPYLLLADLMLYSGEPDKALDYLQKGLARFAQDARLYSALARVYLAADERAKSREQIGLARRFDERSYEARIAAGDLARIEGEARGASRAFEEAIAIKPADDRGWFGTGRIHTEKEEVRRARDSLARAIALNPLGHGYQGELGTLETFANDFAPARSAFDTALAREPGDYVALTGLGLLELKRGNTEAALDAFLRAGLLEPRYARAHVYAAVAYYQLGRTRVALEELARASQLDDKDPLPHFMASIVYNDLLMPGEAIDAARAALRLMPNLKSLNQLANNQRGTTNLGQAFAFLGMEEWAQSYAQESYNPFWAGSHLFLADRYHGLFTKNSELFQGFLADPTAFGNSNRNQTLLQKPGAYFSGALRATSASGLVHGSSPLLQAQGFANGSAPLAWFANQERYDLSYATGPSSLTFSTAAFGLAPRHDIGVFVFANENRDRTTVRGRMAGALADLKDDLGTTNLDIGLQVKLSPGSHVWFKAARFTSSDELRGSLDTVPLSSSVAVRQPEYALRHSFAVGTAHEITWGIEHAERRTSSDFSTDAIPDLLTIFSDYDYSETSLDAYVSDRWKVTPRLMLQADLFHQRHRRTATYVDMPILFGVPLPDLADSSTQSLPKRRTSPRLGLTYRFADGALLRLAYQKWIRSAQFSSLGPVATAGIPLDDRMVQRGGELSRLRGQLEWEISPRTFLTGYVDAKKIEHNPFSLSPFTVSDLETLNRLRSRDLGALARDDMLEFALSPDYEAGRIRTAGGAVNHLLTREWGLFARYVNTASENTGAAFPGNKLPYLPRHASAIGAAWASPSGWYFIGRLVHRTGRFKDEANSERLDSGWNGALDLYWQSRDKRWLLRFSADDALDKNKPTQYVAEAVIRF